MRQPTFHVSHYAFRAYRSYSGPSVTPLPPPMKGMAKSLLMMFGSPLATALRTTFFATGFFVATTFFAGFFTTFLGAAFFTGAAFFAAAFLTAFSGAAFFPPPNMTTSALEAATTTRLDCGAAVSEKALTQARQATRTNERIAEVCR